MQLNQNIQVIDQEKNFQLDMGNEILVHGIIDRIDQLSDGSLGIVDYKSSANQFDIGTFYNGLSPQLATYLAALKQIAPHDINQLFGAMYLHLQDPKLDLVTFKQIDNTLVESIYKALTYKGIFQKSKRASIYWCLPNQNALYSNDELETLLNYNKYLYLKAAKHIKRDIFD